MTEQEINIVIAEARKWRGQRFDHIKQRMTYDAPDYCNDLNLMREAERYLDDDQWLEYMLNLQDVLQRDPNRGKWIVCQDNMHSTAAQRAKAFVITIGKYKDKL
jgi:hypothetical protein